MQQGSVAMQAILSTLKCGVGCAQHGLAERVRAALDSFVDDVDLEEREASGRNALHLAVLAQSDECVELILNKNPTIASALAVTPDADGNTPLHYATGSPLASYDLASAALQACLMRNRQGLTPVDLAARQSCVEALNALLLAAAATRSPAALDVMRALVAAGAVPDTWAPNGQSSLMLAAAADSVEGVQLLLASGATLKLQDALGRTALMWAAGSGAKSALLALLDSGAAVSQRDRRGHSAIDYAEEFPEVKAALGARLGEMELRAAAAQEALLQELSLEEERKGASKASKKAKKKEKAKLKKREEGAGVEAVPPPAAAADATVLVDCSDEMEPPPPEAPTDTEHHRQTGVGRCSDPEADAAPGSSAATPACPPSPGWSIVRSKGQGQQAAKPPPVPAPLPLANPAVSKHQRSPSACSLASSSSSAESQGTEGSRQSGSERSVLWRPSGGNGAGPLPWRQPQQQKQSAQEAEAAACEAAPQLRKVQSGAAAGAATWAQVAAGNGAPQDAAPFAAPAPTAMTSTAMHALSAGSLPLSPAPSAAADPTATPEQAAAEVAALHAELELLRRQAAAAEHAHHEEIAAAMHDAARHEADAVARAVAEERSACAARFARLLPGGAAELAAGAWSAAGSLPDLLCASGCPGHSHFAGAVARTHPGASVGNFAYPSTASPFKPSPQQQQFATGAVSELPASALSAAVLAGLASSPAQGISLSDRAFPAVHPAASQAGSLFGSPLSSSPFTFGEMGEFLRGEFQNNHSAFVVPLSRSPPEGSEATPNRSEPSHPDVDPPLPAANRLAVGSTRFE